MKYPQVRIWHKLGLRLVQILTCVFGVVMEFSLTSKHLFIVYFPKMMWAMINNLIFISLCQVIFLSHEPAVFFCNGVLGEVRFHNLPLSLKCFMNSYPVFSISIKLFDYPIIFPLLFKYLWAMKYVYHYNTEALSSHPFLVDQTVWRQRKRRIQ